jgi:hypothetical protein
VEDVDLVVTSTQQPAVENRQKQKGFGQGSYMKKRGQFVKTEALVSNRGAGRSGPFEVGLFIALSDGRDRAHEFDIIKNVDLGSRANCDRRGISHSYSISVARDYWVVMEADYAGEVPRRMKKQENHQDDQCPVR